MAQNDDPIKSQQRSPNSLLSHPESTISSFDFLNSYRNSTKTQASVSAAAAAALILQAAADSQNSRNSMTLSRSLSSSGIKQRCSSPKEMGAPSSAVAAAAASLMSRPRQHSPTTNSKIQTALAIAMAASSPPSTCPSSSSSGHPGDHGNASDFRCDTQSSLGAIFRQPGPVGVSGTSLLNAGSSYEMVDGGLNGPGEMSFPSTGPGILPPLAPFTSSSGGSPEMSASVCFTNAMLLPASIVNVLGQKMQSNQYHQSQSPVYISQLNSNNNTGPAGFPTQPPPQQQQAPLQQQPLSGQHSDPTRPPFGLSTASSSPNTADGGRYGATGRTGLSSLHDDNNHKREQRLLKNREAARECRRKKKEYVRCLERQVAILRNQNQQLIEELQKVKALCSGALMEQTQCHQGPPNLTDDRHLTGGRVGPDGSGIDFVDSVSSPSSVNTSASGHHSQQHHHKPPRLTSSWRGESNNNTNNNSSFRGEMDVDGASSTGRQQVINDLTRLKSPVSQTQQPLLLLHDLSGSKSGGFRKPEESVAYAHVGGPWTGGGVEKKPNNLENHPQPHAPPSSSPSSPHIHPVKRALKRFGNEQHQLSQLQQRTGEKHAPSNAH